MASFSKRNLRNGPSMTLWPQVLRFNTHNSCYMVNDVRQMSLTYHSLVSHKAIQAPFDQKMVY